VEFCEMVTAGLRHVGRMMLTLPKQQHKTTHSSTNS